MHPFPMYSYPGSEAVSSPRGIEVVMLNVTQAEEAGQDTLYSNNGFAWRDALTEIRHRAEKYI